MRKQIYVDSTNTIKAYNLEEKKFFEEKGYTFRVDFEEVKDEKAEERFKKMREKRATALTKKKTGV